jgi:TonB family protein
MFDQIAKPPIRRRSPLGVAASSAAHVIACAAVVVTAQVASVKLPRIPPPDLMFVNVVPAAPAIVPVKSVVVLPKPVETAAPEIAPVPQPVPSPLLEVPVVQPKSRIARPPLIKDAAKPAPPVVVGAFASVAPVEAPRAVNKQVAATGFQLEQANAPDLRLRREAVGAFDGPSNKQAQPGSDRARPNPTADAGFSGVANLPGPKGPGLRTTDAGFGSAPPPARLKSRPTDDRVVQTGFDPQQITTPTKSAPAPERVTVPLEVVFKPAPTYTTEARTLKIEGDVALEVDFSRSGQVRVVRIISGLGHGLDEAAIAAAEQMRFKPARGESGPVDFRAVVHITFRLT